MRYAVVALTGDFRGYTIKWSILAWHNRAFAGSYAECQAWIAGYKRALSDQEIEQAGKVTLTVVPWAEVQEASSRELSPTATRKRLSGHQFMNELDEIWGWLIVLI